jgi:hypothetical protein
MTPRLLTLGTLLFASLATARCGLPVPFDRGPNADLGRAALDPPPQQDEFLLVFVHDTNATEFDA